MHTVETIPPTVSYCVKNITVGEVTAAADPFACNAHSRL